MSDASCSPARSSENLWQSIWHSRNIIAGNFTFASGEENRNLLIPLASFTRQPGVANKTAPEFPAHTAIVSLLPPAVILLVALDLDRRKGRGEEIHGVLGAQELSRRSWMIKQWGFLGEEKAQHRRSKIWSQHGMVNGFCRELLHSGKRVRKPLSQKGGSELQN